MTSPHPHASMTRRQILAAAIASGATLALPAAFAQAPADASATSPATAPSTFVLALQSFLDPHTEMLVRQCWLALERAGVTVAYHRNGARPHITTASWRVPAFDEQLVHQLNLITQPLKPVPISLTLSRTPRNSISVSLIPESTDALLAYHQNVHRVFLAVGEPFRPIDLPGQWRPHLTIGSFPPEHASALDDALAPFAKPLGAEIQYLGFVTFGQSNRFLATFPFLGH